MTETQYTAKELLLDEKELRAFDGKTVLISGATGLIGSALTEYFLAANECLKIHIGVIAHGRSLDKLEKRFKRFSGDAHLRFIGADVSTLSSDEVEDPVDYIVHAASPAHPVAYASSPVEVLGANYQGTLNLLKLSAEKHARLLYVSSGEVYGEPLETEKDGKVFASKETDYGYTNILDPRACYPEGKRVSETLCVSFNKEYGTDALIARPCQVYGPSITEDNSRADAQFLRKCTAGENIVMKSPGSQLRSMCYVKDAVTALVYMLLYGEKSSAYNIANPDATATIREFAETLAECAGVSIVNDFPEQTEQSGYTKVTHAVLNSSALLSLGWTPRYTLKQGVSETVETVRNQMK